MKIQLIFKDSLAVSTSGLDRIKVQFKDTTLIYDHFGQELEQGSSEEKYIPRQYASNAEADIFEFILQTV